MVGDLAIGILGGMLLNELMDGLVIDEMVEEATEELGIGEEESFLGGASVIVMINNISS